MELLVNQQLSTYACLCFVLPSRGIKDYFEDTLSNTQIRSKIQTVQNTVGKNLIILLSTYNVLNWHILKKENKSLPRRALS